MMQLVAGIITGAQSCKLGSFAALEVSRVMHIGEAVRIPFSPIRSQDLMCRSCG